MKARSFSHTSVEDLAKEIEAWSAKDGVAVRHVGYSTYVLNGKVLHSALVLYARGEDIGELVDSVEAWKLNVLGKPASERKGRTP